MSKRETLIGKVSRGVMPSTKKEGSMVDDLQIIGRLVPHATGGGYTLHLNFMPATEGRKWEDSRGEVVVKSLPERLSFFPPKEFNKDGTPPKVEAPDLDSL